MTPAPMRDLSRGPIVGHLFAMAIPIAVGMLVQTLYYLVDLYFVSRLGGVVLAGVSAAGNTMFLFFALMQTLSVGTVSVVSHAVGAGDRSRANLVFNQAVFLATLLVGGTLLVGYLGGADAYIGTIGADAGTVEAGRTYLYWIIPGLAMQFAVTPMAAALQGTGIVKPTMVVQLLTVVCNIILTPILVAGWGPGPALGVVGAGLSSSLSVGVGLVLMSVYFFRLEHYVGFDASLVRPRFDVLRRMLGIGIPAGGEFVLMFAYMAVIYGALGRFGSAAQAGFGVGSRVMQSIFLPAMAVAFAAPAVIGQNFGARNGARVREAFAKAAGINTVFMVAVTVFCKWQPHVLVQSFSSNEEVLTVAEGFLAIISWNFVAYGLNITCSGTFQGLGNTLPALASSATRLVSFVVPVLILADRPSFRLEHVWYLSVATVTLQAVLSFVLLRWQFSRRLRFDSGDGAGEANG